MRHKDMKVLGISIVEKANASSVTEVLCRIAKITGFPIQILSDNGSNIKKGVADFIKTVSSGFVIRQTYDVTHKAALILKHHLEDDDNWKQFINFTCETKRNLIHTVIGFISPPKPKDKARWLNLDAYVEWAENVMCLGKGKLEKAERDKFNDNLSWVQMFKTHMAEWRTMMDTLSALKNEVKCNGLNKKTKTSFEKSISEFKFDTPRLIEVRDEALAYLEKECTGISGVYPGCSDIIESVLGKYKIFSGKSPMQEVGKAVLAIPAFTSDVDYDEVKAAMESVSAKKLKAWLDENIGESLFARRKRAFNLRYIKSPVKIIPEYLEKTACF